MAACCRKIPNSPPMYEDDLNQFKTYSPPSLIRVIGELWQENNHLRSQVEECKENAEQIEDLRAKLDQVKTPEESVKRVFETKKGLELFLKSLGEFEPGLKHEIKVLKDKFKALLDEWNEALEDYERYLSGFFKNDRSLAAKAVINVVSNHRTMNEAEMKSAQEKLFRLTQIKTKISLFLNGDKNSLISKLHRLKEKQSHLTKFFKQIITISLNGREPFQDEPYLDCTKELDEINKLVASLEAIMIHGGEKINGAREKLRQHSPLIIPKDQEGPADGFKLIEPFIAKSEASQ